MSISKRQALVLGVIAVLIFLWQWKRVPAPPPEYVGEMEGNHPWIIFDPTIEQGLPSAFSDKIDPNILYLIFVMKHGSAVKINLQEKSITSCQFKDDDGDPLTTTPYLLVHSRPTGGMLRHSIPENNIPDENTTIWDEFRGQTETRKVSHMFGYPIADRKGERVATLRSGYWYVMDERNGKRFELLRVKIQNSERGGGDAIGELDLSPNKRWAIFTVANRNPHRVYIFDRDAKTSEVFQ